MSAFSPPDGPTPADAVAPEGSALRPAEAVDGSNRVPEGDDTRQTDRDVLAAVLVPLIPAVRETLESDEEIAEALALAVLRSGFRRVAEDPETVELVSRALFGEYDGPIDGMAWDEDSEQSRERFRVFARAVLRALRGGEQQHG